MLDKKCSSFDINIGGPTIQPTLYQIYPVSTSCFATNTAEFFLKWISGFNSVSDYIGYVMLYISKIGKYQGELIVIIEK